MKYRSKVLGSSLLLASLAALSGCDSSGGTHIAGIGANAPPAGGGSGSGSGSGSGGSDLGALPIGSITGSGGVGGTALLGNVGTAGQSSPLAPVLVTAGNAALGLDGPLAGLASTVNGGAPALSPVTNSLTQTVSNLGNALNGAATGQTPLVDGVTQSASPVMTVALGDASLVGGKDPSLVGLGLGAGASNSGTLLNLNLGSTTQVPAAGSLLGGASAGGAVSGLTALPGASAAQGVVTAVIPVVTSSVLGALPPASSGGLTAGLPVAGTVLGGLGASAGGNSATGALTSLPLAGTVLGSSTTGGATALLQPVTGLLGGAGGLTSGTSAVSGTVTGLVGGLQH
jgi:hypothetical protein